MRDDDDDDRPDSLGPGAGTGWFADAPYERRVVAREQGRRAAAALWAQIVASLQRVRLTWR